MEGVKEKNLQHVDGLIYRAIWFYVQMQNVEN